MILPLRIVQANATAAAEQPRAAPNTKVTFNSAVAEAVKDLVCCAAIATRNTEKGFHVADFEVGDAPRANLPL